MGDVCGAIRHFRQAHLRGHHMERCHAEFCCHQLVPVPHHWFVSLLLRDYILICLTCYLLYFTAVSYCKRINKLSTVVVENSFPHLFPSQYYVLWRSFRAPAFWLYFIITVSICLLPDAVGKDYVAQYYVFKES